MFAIFTFSPVERLLLINLPLFPFAIVSFGLCMPAIGYDFTGALKATGNRGLQPAMDHILEHEGQAIPDLGGVSEQARTSAPMDVDEDDEDAEALKSLGVLKNNEVEAKVCVHIQIYSFIAY